MLAMVASSVEPFATRFTGDSKPKPTKRRESFPSEDTANSDDPMDERGFHLAPQHVLQNMTEAQKRSNEIALLTAEMEHSDNPTRGELFTRSQRESIHQDNETIAQEIKIGLPEQPMRGREYDG